MIKAIVFDLDNTLIDFVKLKRESIEQAVWNMIDAGLEMSSKKAVREIFELYEKYGWEDQKIFQKFLTKNLGKVDWKILASGIVAYRRVRTGYLNSYPHVVSTLLKLNVMGLKLAVLSDAPRLKAYVRLASLKITNYFDVIVTLDDTGKTKPDKKPFLKVINKLSFDPKDILMVGDWLDRDIKGGIEVGMKTCHAKYGVVKNTLSKRSIKAEYSINDVSKLIEIIEKENKI